MSAILVQSVVTCSSDSADEGINDPGKTTLTGVFLDAEVEGLTYQSGNNPPGTTDENGTFEYTPGQELSFSVGGVQLGTLADGAAVCTPYDFVVPGNIARFLQSLDGDGDPSNGIDLTAAAAALAGETVTSDVFENTSSTGFAADPAITGALATAGETLLDTATTNANLRDGTDSTFSPAELAGFAFILVDPSQVGFGIVIFDELANSGDQGSTGSDVAYDVATVQGGDGIAEDFTWTINSTGKLILTFESGELVEVKKVGVSSRAISVEVTEAGAAPAILTLLKPLPVTETSMCGAPITQGGTSTRVFTVTDPNGSEQVTFKSDGTVVGPDWAGFWTVGDIAPNVIKIVDGNNPNLVPNTWSLVVFLSGSPDTGGDLFTAEVTFNGYEVGTDYPNLVWDDFSFVSISAGTP